MDDLKNQLNNLHEDVREIRKEQTEMSKSLASIDKTLALNTSSLEEHHKRTTMNESRIEFIEDKVLFSIKLLKIVTGVLGFLFAAAKAVPVFKYLKIFWVFFK